MVRTRRTRLASVPGGQAPPARVGAPPRADGAHSTGEYTMSDIQDLSDATAGDVEARAASAASYPLVPGYRVNVRQGPGTTTPVVRQLPAGSYVQIRCQRYGQRVSGPTGVSEIWDAIAGAGTCPTAMCGRGAAGSWRRGARHEGMSGGGRRAAGRFGRWPVWSSVRCGPVRSSPVQPGPVRCVLRPGGVAWAGRSWGRGGPVRPMARTRDVSPAPPGPPRPVSLAPGPGGDN